MNNIFFNDLGRLRSGWRFSTFLGSFFAISSAFYLTLVLVVKFFLKDNEALNNFFADFSGIILQTSITLIITLVLSFWFGYFLENLPFKALGWTFHQGWLKDFFWGLGLGFLALLIAVGIPFLFGGISFKFNQTADISLILQTLLSSGIVFIVAAANEETLFRGYLLQTLSRAKLSWLGVLLTSLPFALVHLGNPNVSPFFTFTNTALAGIWLGIAYLKTRSMWFPFALHLVWNWFQGAFFGINVSGLSQLTPNPLLQAVDTGPTWLTGGHYGIEGGISCTIAIILSTVLIYFLPNLKPTPELLALTDEEKMFRRQFPTSSD